MLPNETADSCKVVSLQLEIWGLISNPTSQQLLVEPEELALHSSCTVLPVQKQQPPLFSCLWLKIPSGFFICLLFSLLQEEAILY